MIVTVNSAIHQFNNNTGTVTHHTGLFLSCSLQHLIIFHKNNLKDDTSGFVVFIITFDLVDLESNLSTKIYGIFFMLKHGKHIVQVN